MTDTQIPEARPFLLGERVALRPVTEEDLDGPYLAWLNDPQITRFMDTGILPYSRTELEDFVRGVGAADNQILLAIMDSETKDHIGNVKLGPISWIHRKATLGILIGDRRYWGRGICAETVSLIAEYAFGSLGLHRLDLGVVADHVQARRCYEKVGFVQEGSLRESYFHEGRRSDIVWMGLLREDFYSDTK